MAAEIDGVKRMVKDPEQEELVHAFFLFFQKHQSKTAALKYIQQNYDPDFSWANMRTMLSSEFYKGTYRGIPYCPSYLTETEYADIQRISNKNVKAAPSGRIYLFSGLIRCPVCGRTLCSTSVNSVINRKTGEKRAYCYYRCNRAMVDKLCSNRHRLSQNLVEQYLLDNLEPEFHNYKVRIQKIDEQKKKAARTNTPARLRKELDRLNLLFQKGRVEWDYYSSEYNRIENELQELSQSLPKEHRDFSYLESLLKTDFRKIYDSLSQENRRAFWRSTVAQIHINEDFTVKQVDFL